VDKISSILQAFGIEVSRSYYEEVLENQTSGYIDFDKMLAIISVCVDQSGWMLHEMQESFNIFDKDGNGSLDATELKRVFIKLGEHLTDKQMEDQIKDFDIDHDNEMNLAEYLIMTQQTKGIDFGLDT
jgi:calmodulin